MSSADYYFDWQRLEIAHMDGRRWKPWPRPLMLYAAMSANADTPFTAERLLEALWPESVMDIEVVRVTVNNLRKQCGPHIIETVMMPLSCNLPPGRRGYLVRSPTTCATASTPGASR